MKRKTLVLLLAPIAIAFLPACATAPMTEAEKEAAADRRVKHATEHIRKVGRSRPSMGGGH